MFVNGITKILETFDFTDSIVESVVSVNDLTKLFVTIDYYWDIQFGRSKTRLMVLEFDKCSKIDTNFSGYLSNSFDDLSYKHSFFTIVKVDKISEHVVAFYNNFDGDYFLKVEFATVKIYEKGTNRSDNNRC